MFSSLHAYTAQASKQIQIRFIDFTRYTTRYRRIDIYQTSFTRTMFKCAICLWCVADALTLMALVWWIYSGMYRWHSSTAIIWLRRSAHVYSFRAYHFQRSPISIIRLQFEHHGIVQTISDPADIKRPSALYSNAKNTLSAWAIADRRQSYKSTVRIEKWNWAVNESNWSEFLSCICFLFVIGSD